MNHESRLPPQNLDAERSVLGSILYDNRVLDDVTGILSPEDMYLDAHREIMASILRLRDRESAFDMITLHEDLLRAGKLDDVGGVAYLVKVTESVPHAGHAKHHARLVKTESVRRASIYAVGDVLREAYEPQRDIDDVLSTATDKLLHLLERKTGGAESIHNVALRSMDRLASPLPPGIALGFSDLDEILGGAKAGQLILLGARPGVGKSAMMGNILDHVLRRHGAFVSSIEMTADELFDRMLCSRLGISLGELRPLARDESQDRLGEVRSSLSQLPLMIEDSTEQTVASIGAQARIMQRKQGLGLVVVDYLQLVTPSNHRDPREQQVGQIAWGLKCLAKRLGVPVLALAQLNREIDKRPDKTPRLSDIRESGAIEQHSAVILFLDRPAQWAPDKHGDEEAVLTVAKNRGGRTGRIDLKWDGRSATFKNHLELPEELDVFDGAESLDLNF